jgi:hypothetical protein
MNEAKWRVASGSAVGLAHINQNTECQDRLAWRTIDAGEGEILVAAVADGAGSTTDGQRGAEIACEFFIDQIEEFLRSPNASVGSLTADFGRLWIGYVQRKIQALAESEGKTSRDYASTLVGAVIGKARAAFYQIGDGGLVYSATGAAESYVFGIEPIESEYVNVTDFVTDETATERLRFKLIDEAVEDLILFSDGIYPVAVDYQVNRPHEPFLVPMIAPLRNSAVVNGLNEKLETFLASAKINEKTDDDKTIVLASRAVTADFGF